jgi:hypothetical protein
MVERKSVNPRCHPFTLDSTNQIPRQIIGRNLRGEYFAVGQKPRTVRRPLPVFPKMQTFSGVRMHVSSFRIFVT